MFKFLSWSTTILGTALLAGCGNSSDDDAGAFPGGNAPVLERGTIEVLHASQDAPPVNVRFNGTQRISGLDFGNAGFLPVVTGDITIDVDGILPSGTATVIPAAGNPSPVITLDAGERVTIIAAGDVANIGPIVLEDDQPAVAATEVRLRVVHAASDVPTPGTSVQVWLTDPGLDIVNPPGAGNLITAVFSFGDQLTVDPLVLPAGSYQVRITPPGDPATVVFDSGTIDLPGGADLVIAALSNTGAGGSPVTLAASTGGALLEFFDIDTPADVRVVHASADAPNVDVLLNGAPTPVVNLPFGTGTGYLSLTPGSATFDVVEAGTGGPAVISASPTLVLGETYSVYAVGTTTNANFPIEPLLLVDSPRRVATEARVRIVHASTLAGDVDVYVVAPGTVIDDMVDPTLEAVPFKADSGYLSLPADSYDVAVTQTGSKVAAIAATVNLSAGGLYTIVATDGANLTTPLGVITLDDNPF